MLRLFFYQCNLCFLMDDLLGIEDWSLVKHLCLFSNELFKSAENNGILWKAAWFPSRRRIDVESFNEVPSHPVNFCEHIGTQNRQTSTWENKEFLNVYITFLGVVRTFWIGCELFFQKLTATKKMKYRKYKRNCFDFYALLVPIDWI